MNQAKQAVWEQIDTSLTQMKAEVTERSGRHVNRSGYNCAYFGAVTDCKTIHIHIEKNLRPGGGSCFKASFCFKHYNN